MIDKIKEVRERSSVGLSACKQALEDSHGNVEDALVLLQKRGLAAVKDKTGDANEGTIRTYRHSNGRMFAAVEVCCQTDFSARNELFQEFAEQLVLQVASMDPKYLSSGDVPEDVLEKQRTIFKAQIGDKVPEEKVEHVINGKMKKWFSENCLMDQKSVVVPGGHSMEKLRAELVMKIKENIVVKRFVRWEVGK